MSRMLQLPLPKVAVVSVFQNLFGAHGRFVNKEVCAMRPMTEESASNLLPKVNGWNLISESGLLKLKKSWRVKSFTKGLEMFKLVADVAEAESHHPDLQLVGWNNVTIEIWTQAIDKEILLCTCLLMILYCCALDSLSVGFHLIWFGDHFYIITSMSLYLSCPGPIIYLRYSLYRLIIPE